MGTLAPHGQHAIPEPMISKDRCICFSTLFSPNRIILRLGNQWVIYRTENYMCDHLSMLQDQSICVFKMSSWSAPYLNESVWSMLRDVFSDIGSLGSSLKIILNGNVSVPTFPVLSLQLFVMTSSNGNFSALLALCAGNSPVNGEFLAQRPVMQSLDGCF